MIRVLLFFAFVRKKNLTALSCSQVFGSYSFRTKKVSGTEWKAKKQSETQQ